MKNVFIVVMSCMAFSVVGEEIGRVTTSGMLFKDSITIESFTDPTIEGVACHVTSPNRALSFEEQTNTSISCRQVKAEIKGDYKKEARNIFRRSKGLFFKSMRVDRFYDKENDVLVYLAYTKKLSGDNASHSMSTVPLWLVMA